MSQDQWTEHFFIDDQLAKVILNDHLTIQDQYGDRLIYLDFWARFGCHYDIYQNLTSITIESNAVINLCHDNPTVLEQWQKLFSTRISKTNFYYDYEPGSKIGEGLSASVHTAIHKASKKKVAVKVFPRSTIQQSENESLGFQNEISILKLLDGGYFPHFNGTYVTDKSYYVIYDWCEGMDLKEWVQRGLSSEKDVRHILDQTIKALKQLKEAGVVHRDIKPENIIYDPTTKTLKIVDLGFATLCSNRIHLFPNCGTPGYAAPELLDKNNTVVSYYADVFSLGVTFYFLILGKLPYSEQGRSLVILNKECKFKFDQSLMGRQKLYDFFRRTICHLKYRLSLQQLQNHSYLKGEQSRTSSSFFRNEIYSKLSSCQCGDLDMLNKKIEQKREERHRRERVLSMRTHSQLKKRLSREKSVAKVRPWRYITQIV